MISLFLWYTINGVSELIMFADLILIERALRDLLKMLNSLPEDCISRILSLTTPQDTCIFATLSSFFRSVAESDQVWQQFLPSNYEDVLSRAKAPIPMHISSKKDLFFYLCDPILINDGKNVTSYFLSIIIFFNVSLS